jgi:regulator of nucleoside diphosphate kinase
MDTVIKSGAEPIMVTTAMYDLLKEELRRKRLTPYNEEKLNLELKNARQVFSREIPENVVSVNKLVKIKNVETGEESSYKLVAPDRARRKHNTHSITSPLGVAILGYAEGTEVTWEMEDGIKTFTIVKVSKLP